MFQQVICLVKGDITKYIANMRDASLPKLKLAAKIFRIHYFLNFFFLCGDLKL